MMIREYLTTVLVLRLSHKFSSPSPFHFLLRGGVLKTEDYFPFATGTCTSVTYSLGGTPELGSVK
jgi:hypothetical protein